MARGTTFRILVAYEADEEFAVIIRPQEIPEGGAAQFKSEFDIECGFEKSDWPGHPHLWEQAAMSSIQSV